MGLIDRLSGTSFKGSVESLPAALLKGEEVAKLYDEYRSLNTLARKRVDAWLAKKRPELHKLLRSGPRPSSDAFEAAGNSTEK